MSEQMIENMTNYENIVIDINLQIFIMWESDISTKTTLFFHMQSALFPRNKQL